MNEESYKEKLSGFYRDLMPKVQYFEHFKKIADREIASNFNCFNFIQPNELKLSSIIADLLNPDGTHGQKDLFLRLFFDLLPESVAEICRQIPACNWQVDIEFSTHKGRRIDLLIQANGPSKFVIAIENKPWAIEQENQLKDYAEFIDKLCKDRNILIYLAGRDEEPKSLDEHLRNALKEQGRFELLNFNPHLINWLQACRQQCQADKVRWFLKDFSEYICKEI
ncbi:MAG: hypothetical protein COB67_12975 [SAR324 cluster bacterium]|uniref:PD-(D/E)XK nuclease family protein n=1 Tax=SAR324 cluster bacterium TaxID=2024889 RepID=A0A2A4SPC3_9DELT|nr:MAG: hypothetical protein COB67_12975 [SAR324 cluster bacterium]